MDKIVEELSKQQNIRANLSTLRQVIKDPNSRLNLKSIVQQNEKLWLGFLESEDAKTRKNAALLLGDLKYENALTTLWQAYEKEDTLFVRSSYLTALMEMEISDYLPAVRARLKELLDAEVPEEKRKHVQEETKALRDLIVRYDGIEKHKFHMKGNCKVLLTTNRTHREVIRRSLEDKGASTHPLGVALETNEIGSLMKLRTFRELLFPIELQGKSFLEAEPKKAAESLCASNLLQLVEQLHEGEAPYYFRVEVKSAMDLEKRSDFSKKLAAELERLSNHSLQNSTSAYELEIRLIQNKEGGFFPCLKCYTLEDKRFSYRKNAIAASIHPSTAALMMELAAPYLKENAQIMDPFCGVGTMLIERCKKVGARELYATDIFGEAIEKGRENAKEAGIKINFIHRDFFDFKHEYLFDEIVTNMPVRGKKTKEEAEAVYAQFFDKAKEILTDDAVIIMYTGEVGFVKKQLRLHKEYRLLQETLMQQKGDYYMMILGLTR